MKYVLPVNIFFQEPAMSAQEQLLRITQNNPSIADFWAGFSWQYEKTRNLALASQTTTTTPLILYIIAEKIKKAHGENARPYGEIILSLGSIWGEIERRLENTIADPTVLYGTDLFQDIFSQAYLYNADTKTRMFSDAPRYCNEMETLFAKLETYTAKIPHLYLKYKQTQTTQFNLSFNEYLKSRSFCTLESLTTLNANEIWLPQPNIFNQAQPFAFSLKSPSTWGNYFRSSWSAFRTPTDTPIHFNTDMECTYDLMAFNGHTGLLSFVDNTMGDYWVERERLLWCYANATLLNEGNDTSAIALTCIALYTFNEKTSLISKAFVKEFHDKELSLLKQIKIPDNISLPTLMAALRELNQDERSDWIEGLLLLHNLHIGKLGHITHQTELENLKQLAFLNPFMFSEAYSSAEESYRERFLYRLETNNANALKDKAYADEIIALMELYTRSGIIPSIKYWTQRMFNFIFEQPSWCYNHPIGTFFTIAATVLLGFFPIVALLELSGAVKVFTNFFGPIGGAIASHMSATFLKKIFFMPADHLIHTVDMNDLKTTMHMFEAKPAVMGSVQDLTALQTIRYGSDINAMLGASSALPPPPPPTSNGWDMQFESNPDNLITPLLKNTLSPPSPRASESKKTKDLSQTFSCSIL